MSDQTGLQLLTLTGIAHRCAQETEQFFQRQRHDPRYCFELFRRAIVHRNQRAWELIYTQYDAQVSRWVKRHSAFPTSGEEVPYFVNRAFEKMWVALTAERFGNFPDLKSLLRYLQMCVHSAVMDHVRIAERTDLDVQEERLAAEGEAGNPVVEDQTLDRLHREAFWQEIDARMRTEKERRVVYGSFVLALKPRELYTQCQDVFSDVKEVYRVKENVLARLRRDAELRELLGGDA